MNRKERTITTYRFGEWVALALGDASKETIYLCAGDARDLAQLLNTAAGDIEECETFHKSTLSTAEIVVTA